MREPLSPVVFSLLYGLLTGTILGAIAFAADMPAVKVGVLCGMAAGAFAWVCDVVSATAEDPLPPEPPVATDPTTKTPPDAPPLCRFGPGGDFTTDYTPEL